MNVKIKPFYSASELANMKLKSIPTSAIRVRDKAKKENWQSRKRSGRGGGFEYAFDGLPAEVQTEIKQKCYKSLMAGDKPSLSDRREIRAVAVANRDLNELTDEQRETADARLRMTLLVNQYQLECGTRIAALRLVSRLSREQALPVDGDTDWNAVCATAKAKATKKPGVGQRMLHQWCVDADKCETALDRLKVFAPAKQGQPETDLLKLDWLPDFMAVYRNTNGVSITRAYRQFALAYRARHGAECVPHEAVVRRALAKMPVYVLQQGRITGAELKSMLTYVKRDWSLLQANDVWVGDGHSLKMKVQHPEHGRPFTPELTVIMDAASRFVVGWSLSYSESQLAVADALRHGISRHGQPAIYYSDNGSGQTNKTFDADITGILPRLGIHHETGIPGNPQGRGIIERFMKEAPNLAAQQFATYYGSGADRETTRKTLVAVDSLAKAQNDGKTSHELTPKQRSAQGKLPTWQELMTMLEACFEWYNNEHEHRSLGKSTPAMTRQVLIEKHPDSIMMLSEAELQDLHRPAFIRTVQRAWLTVFNNNYWHKDLEPLDRQQVMVCVDQHDAAAVIVRDMSGKYICQALLDGNKRAAFPESLVERKRRLRSETRMKKLDDEKAKATAELRPAIEHDDYSELTKLVVGSDNLMPAKKTYSIFASDLDD